MIDQQPIKYQYVFVSTQKGILEYRNPLCVKTTFQSFIANKYLRNKIQKRKKNNTKNHEKLF